MNSFPNILTIFAYALAASPVAFGAVSGFLMSKNKNSDDKQVGIANTAIQLSQQYQTKTAQLEAQNERQQDEIARLTKSDEAKDEQIKNLQSQLTSALQITAAQQTELVSMREHIRRLEDFHTNAKTPRRSKLRQAESTKEEKPE